MTTKEPVALGALVQMVLNAILTGLTEFNVIDFTGNQTAYLYGAVNVVMVVFIAFKTRAVVYSPYTIREAMAPSPETLGRPPA
jgi:hypothetical protein